MRLRFFLKEVLDLLFGQEGINHFKDHVFILLVKLLNKS